MLARSRLLGFLVAMGALWSSSSLGEPAVQIDASATPEHSDWAASTTTLANEWYPRLGNLLASDVSVDLPGVRIRIDPSFHGVAEASGTVIRISADWVKKNPEDARGVVIHELVHVVQAYPENREGWITEGIADYLRCGIYEARPLRDFPRPSKESAYRDGYKVAAGFLLWLESGPAPGTVRRLNAALRRGTYGPETFQQVTGTSADTLWKTYCEALSRPAGLPPEPRRFTYEANGGGVFVRRDDGSWVERQQGRDVWQFRETRRTPEAIEILDEGRQMRLRLTGGGVEWQRDGRWEVLYSGSWVPGLGAPGNP